MKKKITFWKLLSNWFLIALVLGLVNVFLLKSSILNSLILASLGIILLIFPVYPLEMENKYTTKQCKIFIRIIAIIEILLSFAVKTTF